MTNHIWSTIYASSYVFCRIWIIIYACAYMVPHIWTVIYKNPIGISRESYSSYTVNHIRLIIYKQTIYERSYMGSYTVMIICHQSYTGNHIRTVIYGTTIYGRSHMRSYTVMIEYTNRVIIYGQSYTAQPYPSTDSCILWCIYFRKLRQVSI